MNMGERIKKLRRTLELTQQAFGAKIGTTQNNIASYETGRREPSSAALNNICKTFTVNEIWLRTGEGEMFLETSDNALDMLATKYGLSHDARALVEEFVNLKPDIQQAFVDYALNVARSIANETEPFEAVLQTKLPADPDEKEEYDPEVEAELAEMRRQLLLEKRAKTSRQSTYGNAG